MVQNFSFIIILITFQAILSEFSRCFKCILNIFENQQKIKKIHKYYFNFFFQKFLHNHYFTARKTHSTACSWHSTCLCAKASCMSTAGSLLSFFDSVWNSFWIDSPEIVNLTVVVELVEWKVLWHIFMMSPCRLSTCLIPGTSFL